MKIYILLHFFTAHKRQSKRRRNTALKKIDLWAKELPLLGVNRLTPLLGWPQSCFVSSGWAHLVRPGASCPLQLPALRSHLPWLLASATAGLTRAVVLSCGVGDCGAAGTCLAPASDFPPSSLPVARQPLPSCCSCAFWPLWGVWAKWSPTCLPQWPGDAVWETLRSVLALMVCAHSLLNMDRHRRARAHFHDTSHSCERLNCCFLSPALRSS